MACKCVAARPDGCVVRPGRAGYLLGEGREPARGTVRGQHALPDQAYAPARPEAHLLLDVAGTPCALPRSAVAEILPLPDLFRPPACGAWLAGFLDLGGSVLPVVDLAQILGLRAGLSEPGPHAHLVRMAGEAVVYQVERATDLVAVEADSLRAVAPGHSLNGCVAAEIRREGGLVHVLDPARLLSAEERIRVAEAARAARARLAALPGS